MSNSIEHDKGEITGNSQPEGLAVLPLRDVVVYPHMVIPLFVGRSRSIKALEVAMLRNKQVFLTAQIEANVDDPKIGDFYEIGTVATILQLLRLPDNTVKVLVEGIHRAKAQQIWEQEDCFFVTSEMLADINTENQQEIMPMMRGLLARFEEYIKLNRKIPAEIMGSLNGIEDPGRLADTIAAHLSAKLADKQKILESLNVHERLIMVLGLLETEIEMLQIEQRVQKRVKRQMEKSQREYYLREKISAIQKELGELGEEGGGAPTSDYDLLKKRVEEAGMSDEAKEKALAELNKLRTMPSQSAEATVSRNYLDWLLAMPWKALSEVSKDLTKAESILEADHYGLEKIKERIIEYLAVQQRVAKAKGPILCLVGPPGVGKTSLGQSIARATGREFVRISLGGIRDEAEIRGHRRTYIGSMPGKIIQKLAKVKVRNPLFMLDEVDKMAMDFRGDPASALLEVLDPEQNHAFNDHYIEVDYDLSEVMFIATANSLDIPPALLDRMEVIRLAGYTEDEKLNIAIRYLIPKQIKETGLKAVELNISNGAVLEIIRRYTREAGVRSLEREISKICRKVVKQILLKPSRKRALISQRNIPSYLGVPRFHYGLVEEHSQIGRVNGLAWTEVGGEMLTVEAVVLPGKGKSIFTGRLGDVMQESIQAAMTVVRSRANLLGILDDFYQKHDFHVHFPEGATPKDGPSAGIAVCTALVSALTRIPVRADVAMTGEITLRGEVLAIGGLKEKLLAALRAGVKTVLIPQENVKDLKEIPKNVTQELDIKPVRWVDEVLGIALQSVPKPLSPEPLEEVFIPVPAEEGKGRKKPQRPSQAH
ncbi:MAG: endopeptidase La [Gammaproteobacteria bacterium]